MGLWKISEKQPARRRVRLLVRRMRASRELGQVTGFSQSRWPGHKLGKLPHGCTGDFLF